MQSITRVLVTVVVGIGWSYPAHAFVPTSTATAIQTAAATEVLPASTPTVTPTATPLGPECSAVAFVCVAADQFSACDNAATAALYAAGLQVTETPPDVTQLFRGTDILVDHLRQGHTYHLSAPGVREVDLAVPAFACFYEPAVRLEPARAGDLNGDGETTIDKILRAVAAALELDR